ncbi:MAG: metallophosphoesterase family protein [Bacteroidetes bacterium]|nr:metallophosphoesterase family protein [Bacteroidota bacterium]MCW5897425.1 metallophosphoesterase family protein [Bacteroidota bacterium]
MRVAILADIHSNLQALAKAFSIIDRSRIDEIYCLGDIVGYGANPNECLGLIRERCTLTVLGNHDLAAIDTSVAHYFTKPGRIAAEWTHSVLTPDNIDFLKSLPYSTAKEQATLVHASPHEPEQWTYVSSLVLAQKQFPAFATPLCFIGHTHIPFVCGENLKTFSLKKDMRFLINVGSVGQPRDGNPQLSFGMFDSDSWSYQNIRSEYDIDGAAKAILAKGLPTVLAKRLSLGE